MTNMKKPHKNIILFLVGFVVYMLIELIYRQRTYLLMGCCGGVIILILDKINDKISWDVDLLLQGSIGSLVITFFEFIIGELFIHNYIPVMWDYSNMPLNYKGIICLPFSAIWFLLSIGAVFLADAINYYLLNENDTVPYYKMFGKIILKFKEK